MEACVSLENRSRLPIQAEIHRVDSMKNRIIPEREGIEIDFFNFALISSPEAKDSRITLRNLSEDFRVEIFIEDEEKNVKKRSLYPGGSRYLKFSPEERCLIIPVLLKHKK